MAFHRVVKDIEKLKTAFMVSGDPEFLPGGQGQAFRIGGLVFKPVDDVESYTRLSELLSSVKPKGYRLPVHAKSINGNVCEYGYCVTEFVSGRECSGRLKEKLMLSELYHKDLAGFDPSDFPLESNRWESANSVLWRNRKIPTEWVGKRKDICEFLVANLDKVTDPYQLIHGDLSGNIMFDDKDLPVIIDFSPTVAPKKYADAIIISDAITWDSQAMVSLELLKPFDEYRPYIKYAVAFRVLTMAFTEEFCESDFLAEWNAYKPIWDAVC